MDDFKPAQISCDVNNTDRAFGTILGSRLTEKFAESLADDTYVINAQEQAARVLALSYQKALQ